MKTLLLLSRDLILLETRKYILERSGFHVIAVSRLSDLPSASVPVELIVVCHTLSEQDCNLFFQIVEVRWPHARALALVTPTGNPPCGDRAVPVSSLGGPAKLIAAVQQLA